MDPQVAAVLEMMRQQNAVSTTTTTTTAQSSQISVANETQGEERHAFWDNQVSVIIWYFLYTFLFFNLTFCNPFQPMPHQRDELPEGPIEPNKPSSEIRQEPFKMPQGFVWTDLDIDKPEQRLELYNLLAQNYVEDHDAYFRFEYSQEFLEWALRAPGYRKEWLVCVRSESSGKLVAFISAIPANASVRDRGIPVVEINFLCIHKKLREKRLAPVLIREITRRVNLQGTFQAVYTAGSKIPVPIGSARYYHRSLNPKKLVNIGFSRLGPRMTMARLLKLYKLPDAPDNPLRPMEERDVDGVHDLLTAELQQYALHFEFTREEIAHWLLPRDGVINSFVMEKDGKVTDFVSFYHLPSTVLQHNDTLRAAYSFYNVATTVDLETLMRDALILAKSQGSDVYNCLNLMQNSKVLEELKFAKGDGELHYYVYNWSCPEVEEKDIGIVLL